MNAGVALQRGAPGWWFIAAPSAASQANPWSREQTRSSAPSAGGMTASLLHCVGQDPWGSTSRAQLKIQPPKGRCLLMGGVCRHILKHPAWPLCATPSSHTSRPSGASQMAQISIFRQPSQAIQHELSEHLNALLLSQNKPTPCAQSQQQRVKRVLTMWELFRRQLQDIPEDYKPALEQDAGAGCPVHCCESELGSSQITTSTQHGWNQPVGKKGIRSYSFEQSPEHGVQREGISHQR